MRKIILGFSKPKNKFLPIFSWAIRLVEWTPYSHVFVRIKSESLSTTLIYQASGTQVNFMGLKHFEDAAHIIKEFEFDISDAHYLEMLRWAVQEAGAPYGLKAVLGIFLVKCFNLKRNPFSDKNKTWFCSELAGKVLRDFIGVYLKEDELEIVGPRRIFEICSTIRRTY
jgi:hypothetical protein